MPSRVHSSSLSHNRMPRWACSAAASGPCRGRCRWRIMASSFSMSARSSGAMSSRCSYSRSRRASQKYNFRGVLDLTTLAALATQVASSRDKRPCTTPVVRVEAPGFA
jgi:hypothetical protein